MSEKKGRKTLIIVLICLGIGLVAIAGLGILFLIYFFTGGPAEVTKDVNRYEETMRKYTQEVVGTVHTGFFVFPDTIPESAFENDPEPVFYFSYQDTWDDPTCEVYLKCTYSDADYEKEITRLGNDIYELENADDKARSKLEYEADSRFAHPVFKAIDCYNYSYEYAMDLGNNEIAYIYTSFKSSPESLKAIPEEYLPSDYSESLKHNNYDNGAFNVYVIKRTDEFTSLDYGERFR